MGWFFYNGVPIRNQTSDDDMKYPVETIDLVADTQYDLTTTLTSSRTIYNVLIEDSSGNDITESVDRSWAAVSDYWHVYITSSENLSSVKVKIIY